MVTFLASDPCVDNSVLSVVPSELPLSNPILLGISLQFRGLSGSELHRMMQRLLLDTAFLTRLLLVVNEIQMFRQH